MKCFYFKLWLQQRLLFTTNLSDFLWDYIKFGVKLWLLNFTPPPQQTNRLSDVLRVVPVCVSILPTPIINLQPSSPAAGTCQDERQGLETERECEKVGHTILASRVPLLGRLCVLLCVCVMSNAAVRVAAGTVGWYPDLCVCVFLQESCVAYMIARDSLCLFYNAVLEKTITTHHAHP